MSIVAQADFNRSFAFLIDFVLGFFRLFRELLFHIGCFVHGARALLQSYPAEFFCFLGSLPGRIFRFLSRIFWLPLAATDNQEDAKNYQKIPVEFHCAVAVIGANFKACTICR